MVANTRITSLGRGDTERNDTNHLNDSTRKFPADSQQPNNYRHVQEGKQSNISGEEDFNELFQHGKRFSFIKILGRGSYGVKVCSAYDKCFASGFEARKHSGEHKL